ncbi:MAG TPA: amidohydrolase family protein, partial [Burkholderiales bacterium]|nr:amidohydrolase family protein [Burkholderiales bacterium]
ILPQQRAWSQARSLEEMDAAGVRKAYLSVPSTPGVWFDAGPAEANRMARVCNEYAAQMVREHPARFGFFATLPMLDVEASLRELEHAFGALRADGVGLQTSYGDKWPGDAAYRPVLEELDRRKALVYFHPLAASCCGRLADGVPPSMLEYPHDTTRAVASLLSSGSLARYRNIRWLFSHGGGTVPMLAGRMEFFFRNAKNLKEIAPQGIEAELQRLYYDTANATHRSAMAALLQLVPSSQVVFGSDHPYVTVAPQAAELASLGLAPAVLAAIEGGNAERLLAGRA